MHASIQWLQRYAEKERVHHFCPRKNSEVPVDVGSMVCRSTKTEKLARSSQAWKSFHTQKRTSVSAGEFSTQQTRTPPELKKKGNVSLSVQIHFPLTSSEDPNG